MPVLIGEHVRVVYLGFSSDRERVWGVRRAGKKNLCRKREVGGSAGEPDRRREYCSETATIAPSPGGILGLAALVEAPLAYILFETILQLMVT